jgi:hypothetical protein
MIANQTVRIEKKNFQTPQRKLKKYWKERKRAVLKGSHQKTLKKTHGGDRGQLSFSDH